MKYLFKITSFNNNDNSYENCWSLKEILDIVEGHIDKISSYDDI